MEIFMIVWIIIMVSAAVLEVFTNNLVSIWFSGGAIAALLVSLIGFGEMVQCVVFVLVTVILLILTRPFVLKLRKQHTPTNADRIIGQHAFVLQQVDNENGQIKVQGMVWSAKNKQGIVLEKDTKVKIVAIEGVKAVVEPSN